MCLTSFDSPNFLPVWVFKSFYIWLFYYIYLAYDCIAWSDPVSQGECYSLSPICPGSYPDGLFSLCSVYSGHQSILIPPSELETNPALWLLAVSQYKVRDTFCSYSVMELCTKGLGSQTESLKVSSPTRASMLTSPQATLVLRKDTHTLGEASTKSWSVICLQIDLEENEVLGFLLE